MLDGYRDLKFFRLWSSWWFLGIGESSGMFQTPGCVHKGWEVEVEERYLGNVACVEVPRIFPSRFYIFLLSGHVLV